MILQSAWRSPSNIALVKYWGKHGIQLPRNPSLSFTLQESHTTMKMVVDIHATSPSLVVMYDGQPRPQFEPKIKSFFTRIHSYFPWLSKAAVTIDSVNTFPYGAGIASSASAMSAMALCLTEIDGLIHDNQNPVLPLRASFVSTIARMGSGSAARSVFPLAALWGATPSVENSSDEYAIPWNDQIDSIYKSFHDTILIISSTEKSVSSTAGHELMNDLVYADVRYSEAHKNVACLTEIMRTSDHIDAFIALCESEALQLHALMMSGPQPYILIEPNTIAVIRKLWQFRNETSIPVCFTLDAGPNVHVLYPHDYHVDVMTFIKSELQQLCSNGLFIEDCTGAGPQKIEST